MSYDLRIRQQCNHRVIEERHTLEPDGRTVRFVRPPANLDDVVVKIFRETILPESDVFRYSFEVDETKVDQTPKLVFQRPLKLADPLIEISYSVTSNNCRRCAGSLVEYDPKPDDAGNFQVVRHEELIAQTIEKWLLTIRGTNQFRPYIGTDIVSTIGSRSAAFLRLITSRIYEQLRKMASRVQRTQSNQLSYQEMSPRELLASVEDISVLPVPDNPLVLRVIVAFTTVEGTVMQIEPKFKMDPSSEFFKNVGKFTTPTS